MIVPIKDLKNYEDLIYFDLMIIKELSCKAINDFEKVLILVKHCMKNNNWQFC